MPAQTLPRPSDQLTTALLAALLTYATPGAAESPVIASTATPELLRGRLRVMGRPGDPALVSRAATAVVRAKDGALVDFWPDNALPASAPQLKNLRAIDGLWLVQPIVHVGEGFITLRAEEVRLVDDAIEAIAAFSLGKTRVHAVTRYQLDPAAARLLMTTRFEIVSGGRVLLMPGDLVKWGNVDYYIEGVGRAPRTFHGSGRTIGRKGAGGDLLLRSLEREPMRIDYRMVQYGIAADIRTRYKRSRLLPGESWVVRRSLSYEPILTHAEPVSERSSTIDLELRDEAYRPLPFKISLRGRRGTRDPDFGNDGDESGAGRFAWSGNGRLSVDLVPGQYRVLATAGYERDAASWDIDIRAGDRQRLTGVLPRVINTPGVIAADLHLHHAASVDADIAGSTRVISVAAEGVELAVSTDHYTASDLGPTVRQLQASGELTAALLTMIGTEVSTVGNHFGHFNVFPVTRPELIGYENSSPRQLFSDMRRAAPEGIVQVNHPRLHDLGYFHRFGMDPKSGRIPSRSQGAYDSGFDTLEVYNGFDAWTQPKVRLVLLDWIHLLGQGFRYTATGGSDSHKLFFSDPGLPRTMIRYGTAATDAEDLSVGPEAIVRALRAGRASVTSGPIIDVDVAGAGPGETSRGGGVMRPLRIRVRAAPWVDVSDVEVLLGGNAERLRWINVAPSSRVIRYEGIVQVPVRTETFVVVVAVGRRELPNVHTPNVKPMAFTNPIWLVP